MSGAVRWRVVGEPLESIPAPGIGVYLCDRVIARGGMGIVYRATLKRDDGSEEIVAVKIVDPVRARESRFVRMFLSEADVSSRLQHPNVCRVFDFGSSGAIHYLAMELLDGRPLDALLSATPEGRLPLAIACNIVRDAARGAHAAHELLTDEQQPLGVVHRDLSPHNIFVLASGQAKVIDFGIAHRDLRPLEEITRTGELRGKLAYMAPEQIRHFAIDRRTDVFALGIVLWEATVGRRLFKRATEMETMLAVVNEPIPRPSSIVAGYPRELERIVMRALAREPAERYPDAAAFAADLETITANSAEPMWAEPTVHERVTRIEPVPNIEGTWYENSSDRGEKTVVMPHPADDPSKWARRSIGMFATLFTAGILLIAALILRSNTDPSEIARHPATSQGNFVGADQESVDPPSIPPPIAVEAAATPPEVVTTPSSSAAAVRPIPVSRSSKNRERTKTKKSRPRKERERPAPMTNFEVLD